MKECIVDGCTEGQVSQSKCRTHYNEYMKNYMLQRYHRRRELIIDELGGECTECGSTEELEIDHLNPEEKSFDWGKALAGYSEKRIREEIIKSQLLCNEHHEGKTRKDLAKKFGQREHWEHGTLAGYRYCREECCKKAKSKSNKEYRQKNKNKIV